MDNLVILVTAPSEEDAARIGKAVVEEGLVACANIIPRIRSIYKWDGDVCDDGETLMIMKTRNEKWGAVEKRVKELHGYDVPEIIAIPIEKGSEAYLNWIRECT